MSSNTKLLQKAEELKTRINHSAKQIDALLYQLGITDTNVSVDALKQMATEHIKEIENLGVQLSDHEERLEAMMIDLELRLNATSG